MPFTIDILPTNTRIPGEWLGYDTTNALTGVQVSQKQMCIVALKTDAGRADDNVEYEVPSEAKAISLFGKGSPAHIAYRNALATFPYGRYSIVAVKQTEGTKASGSITFSGIAAEGGYITVIIGQESVKIPVYKDDKGTDLAERLKTALSSNSLLLEAAISGTESSVTVTALCAGDYGNTIGIEATIEDADGVAVAINKMIQGSDGTLELSTALQNLAGNKNDIVIFPFDWETADGSGDFGTIVKYIDKVSSPIEKKPAICVIGQNGDLVSLTDLPETPNHRRFCFVNAKNTNMPIYSVLAAVGADILYRDDPAYPLDGDILPVIKPASTGNDYLREEVEYLLSKGIMPLEVTSGRVYSIIRLISTETDGISEKFPDMWIRSLDVVAEAVRNDVEAARQGQKNTERMVGAMRAVIIGTMKNLEKAEIVKNVELWKNRLTVERSNENTGFFTVKIPTDVVLGLHGVIGHFELIV